MGKHHLSYRNFYLYSGCKYPNLLKYSIFTSHGGPGLLLTSDAGDISIIRKLHFFSHLSFIIFIRYQNWVVSWRAPEEGWVCPKEKLKYCTQPLTWAASNSRGKVGSLREVVLRVRASTYLTFHSNLQIIL